MDISMEYNDRHCTVYIKGRIDTTTAPLLSEKVSEIKESVTSVCFDFKEVEYISSAGLRLMIIAKKRFEDVVILHANSTVKEIFEMTGLDQMLELNPESDKEVNVNEVLPTNLSFREFLMQKVALCKDQTAFIFEGKTYSYKDIHSYSEAIATILSAAGVKKRTHVGLCGTNSPYWIFTFFAIQKLGAIAIFINPTLNPNELQQLKELGDITHLCIGDTAHELNKEVPCTFDFSCLKMNDFPVPSISETTAFQTDIEADDPCVMIFSSGTTSLPKAVLLSSYHIFNNCVNHCKTTKLSPNDKQCLIMPLFHIFGFSCMLSGLMMNAVAYIPKDTSSKTVLALLQQSQCTVMHSVPTLMLALAGNKDFDQYDISHLHSTILAGAVLSENNLKILRTKFPNNHFGVVYGLSEIAPVSAIVYEYKEEDELGSVGKPVDDVDVLIQNPQNQEICTSGESGEVLVKSPNQMVCYYKLPIEKQPYDEEGWLHTGDLGYFSENGYLHLIGRSKDLIIRGGENIAPNEIANVMSGIHGIKDVLVIGVPSEFWGEEVGACIVMEEGATFNEETVKEYLSKQLAKFKVPSHYFLFDSFPSLANGKIDVKEVKKTALSRLEEN